MVDGNETNRGNGTWLTRATVLRRGLVGIAAGAGALALGACGAGSSSGGEASSQSKKPVKLTFEWPTYTPPKQEWAEYAMKTYSQKFPHATVEPMWNTNPTEKLTTTLAGGQPPDVGWFGVGHWAFHQAFKPIESFLSARKIKVDDYLPKVVDAMKWRGKMLAFPMGINTTAMFVNTGQYQKAGVPLPNDEQTWDDVLNTGKRLTTGEGPAKIWSNNAPYYTNSWPAAYGGQWLDADGNKVLVNNPVTLKMLTLVREMWEKQGLAPTPKENADIGLLPLFATGRTAQFAGGTWGLDPFRKESFQWDLVEVPTLVDGGKKYKGAFCGTEEIFVIKGSPNEEAAADFATWLIGPEHLAWAGGKGHIIPAHQKTAKEAFASPASEPRPKNIQAFVRAAAYAPPIIPHPHYNELNKAFNTAIAKWLGSAAAPVNTLTAQQALEEAQRDMQRLLDDWNKANPK